MNRFNCQRAGRRDTNAIPHLCIFVLGLALTAFGAGCVRYDVPRAQVRTPGVASWGVEVAKSGGGYRVTSTTQLNGRATLWEKPSVQIVSGTDESWEWVVKAVPSVATGSKALTGGAKLQQNGRDDASDGKLPHAAPDWGEAFRRAHRVARYLLGRRPPALHATLLLLPYGVRYSRAFTKAATHYFPLTFAYYYWPRSKHFKESASLATAVTSVIYEYQHLLVASKTIAPVGKTKGSRAANNEARSRCWSQSTFLALEAGTTAHIEYGVPQVRGQTVVAMFKQSMPQQTTNAQIRVPALPPGSQPHIRFSDAYAWGSFFEIESLARYLQLRGVPNLRVMADNPSEANAVFSVCRAMTQHPVDITATNGYPPSQVQFLPFFPGNRKGPRPSVASGTE